MRAITQTECAGESVWVLSSVLVCKTKLLRRQVVPRKIQIAIANEGCVGGPKRLIPRGEGALHVAHYGEAAPVRTPVDNPYVMELLHRLGYESVESLTQEDTMFRRQF